MTNIAMEIMTIEIVDLPIDSMVIFHSYVSLPEIIMTIGILRMTAWDFRPF